VDSPPRPWRCVSGASESNGSRGCRAGFARPAPVYHPRAAPPPIPSDRACYNPAPGDPAPLGRDEHGRLGVREWLMLVVGTGLGLLSLTADLVGIGGFPGFGWKQVLGTLAGIGLVVVAALRILRRGRGSPE
jgi:hypothetical protein